MNEQDKQLLLIDLCGRLPHGVKVQVADYKTPVELSHIDTKNGNGRKPYCFVFAFEPERVKPYLRSMSSMTEEEREELRQEQIKDEQLFTDCIKNHPERRGLIVPHFASEWCDKNMFDYRGLIPKGLANEAPNDMYKI